MAKFTKLARFMDDYVATNMAKVRKFEDGLKLSIRGKIVALLCGPYPIHGPARLASKMEGKCEKKMRVDFRVWENPSQRRNGFALESPLTFIFIFKWGKPSKNKKPQ